MQEKFIAMTLSLAVAVPIAAHAEEFKLGGSTTVNINGLFAVGAKSGEVTNTKRAVQAESRVDDNTSRLIVSGNTSLGNGIRAIFRVESRFATDSRPGTPLIPGTSTTVSSVSGWGDGDTWAGLAGPFGSLYFGKSMLYFTDTMSMPNLGINGAGEAYRVWDANGLATFNLLGEVGTRGGNFQTLKLTRSMNVMRWDSPLLGGADFSLAYTKNSEGDENHFGCASCNVDYAAGGTWYGRARYNSGPLTASFSVFHTQVQGGAYTAPYLGPLDKTGYRAGVGYAFGNGVKAGLVYDNTSVRNGIPGTTATARRGAYSIPLSYNWDGHAAYLTYTRANDTSGLDQSGATQLNLGYDYALAKNTFVGVFLTRFKNDAKGAYAPFMSGTALGSTSPLPGEGHRQLSLNLNYWF